MITVPARYIQITFLFKGVHPVEALEKTFSNALDWIRIADHLWILYSNTDLDTWRDRIKATPGIVPADSFFLSEFSEGQYSGFQVRATWDWFRKAR
jgi:hypothetical protein